MDTAIQSPSKQDPRKTGSIKLENASLIDNLGQNLVDQVFYEQQVSYLVVEITDKNKDAFLL